MPSTKRKVSIQVDHRRVLQRLRSLSAPKLFCLALASCLLLLAPLACLWAQSPVLIHVDADATGDNSGQSWEHAYTDLQDALAVTNASPGTDHEIWVAAGLYLPGTQRTDSFRIERNNVQLYGGFAGGETSRVERDWAANETILSGDINASGDLGGNAYHVVFVDGQTLEHIASDTVIDGFVITAGAADGAFPNDLGGGMLNDGRNGQASPTLANLVFRGNSASFEGGGMANFGVGGQAAPTLTNISFNDNSANTGGAMYNDGKSGISSPVLTNVSFSGNSAVFGGAIRNFGEGAAPEIRNSVLWNNTPDSISNADNANATFSHSLIEGCNPDGEWNDDCGTDGGNNLADANPLFVDPDEGNLRLQSLSPAIDRGNNAYVDVENDLDGNPRIRGGAVELGAYELSLECPADGGLFVDQNVESAGTGLSWETAFSELQTALHLTEACEIWVAAGTYKPTPNPDDRFTSFRIVHDGIRLYGGFAGSETSRDERNWAVNETILSGDINDSGVLDNNAIHVVFVDGEAQGNITADTVINGFTITGGQTASGVFPNFVGGGLYCAGAGFGNECSPMIVNVRFIQNTASQWGGAMFNSGRNSGTSNPTLINVSFSGNSASFGGAMYNDGIFFGASNPVLNNVSFNGNHSRGNGGAIYNTSFNSGSSSPVLTNVSFSKNSAYQDGGAIYNKSSQSGTSSPVLTHVSFGGNSAGNQGNTIFNEALEDGQANFNIRNSILWNSGSANIANVDDATATFSHSLIGGCNPAGEWNDDCGTDAGNNLADADPLFADPKNDNLRLQPRSPGIDAGNNDYSAGMKFDLDGNPRIFGPAADLGPFETSYLKIDLEIIGQGLVEGDPAPMRYDSGEVAVIEAIAELNWSFEGWSGDILNFENPAALVMTADRSITATFVIDRYDISISADPKSGGTVVCDPNPVDHGTDSICTATANPGFAFTGWSGDCAGTDPSCVLESVTDPKSVTANFESIEFVIEVSIEPAEGGSAQCDPNPVPEGESSACTAEAFLGFEFTYWSGACEGDTCELGNVTEEKTVTANFTVLDPVFHDRFERNDED